MNWRMFLRVGLAALVVLFVNPAAGQNEKVLSGERACTAAVRERLSRMGIDSNNVRSISIATRLRATRGRSKSNRSRSPSVNDGFEGWVRLRTCSGHLVVNLDRECRAKKVYGRGDCKGRF